MDIRDLVKATVEAKRCVDGIDGNFTFNEANALKEDFECKLNDLILELVSKLGEALILIAKEFPELWNYDRMSGLVCGLPYKVTTKDLCDRDGIFRELSKGLKYFVTDVKPECLDIFINCGPKTLNFSEEHGNFFSIPMAFLEDDFDPKENELVKGAVERAKALYDWNMIFGGIATINCPASAVKVMAILNKYPKCVDELKKMGY